MIQLSDNRLFQIIYYLLDHGQASAVELAERFEVSVRTIYRDIDRLSGAGIPIYAAAGRGGGIRLLGDFVMDKSLLSKQEMQDILLAMQSLSAVQYPDSEGILSKLRSTFRMTEMDWIEVDFSRWGCTAGQEKQAFSLSRQAILERRQIHFVYYNSNGRNSERTCQPLKILYKDKAWYLYAYCLMREDYRLFRMSRIRQLCLTETHFSPHESAKLPALSTMADFGPPISLELHFTAETGHRLYDVFDDSAVTVTDTGFLVHVTLPKTEWLYEFILSFGEKITILSPSSLKDEIKGRLEAALQHHKSS